MGKHGFEHRPTTVVQAPFCAERHRDGGIPLAEQIGDFTGRLWMPGRGSANAQTHTAPSVAMANVCQHQIARPFPPMLGEIHCPQSHS